MIELEIDLVAYDGSARETFACSFTEDEWTALQDFHDEVEALRSTDFVQNKRGGTISINVRPGQPIFSNAPVVNDQEVWSMLHKLRPFVLEREQFHLLTFKKILDRRLRGHPSFANQLDMIKRAFQLEIMREQFELYSPGRNPLSLKVVMDWLNAFEYHRNPKKRADVKNDLWFFGDDQDGRPIMLFALVDMIQSVLTMDDLVATLLQIPDGTNEVKCPANWLTGA